jgi:benzylsuccinate CoA-transferase BbsF subunit
MEAHPKIPYPDDTAANQMVLAVLAALEHRDRTGEGQYLEIAQVEGLAYMLTPAYLDYLINGRDWEPRGNWHPVAAPFGVYRCLGHDAWLAISCETEEQWRGLVQALGSPDWAGDPRFATRDGRREARANLDVQIEGWTAEHTPRQAMELLQRAGAPAFEVSSNEDLYFDLHLRERGLLRRGSFPKWPTAEYRGPAVALSETPGRVRKGAPEQGEDNYAVLGALLGLSREEVDRLKAENVVN